ncbi:unnamed protein product [Dracunculus medinensis]|uniref:Alpha/beta hydrolase n=1 Tax=Dracunculus medinensis TaxID=318479 RepID=A0A0N4UAG9_DRAME|nr:unnamed protein product [Dracunculus medinensis]
MELIERIKPTMYITKEIKQKGIKYLEGYFESPYGAVFPEMMPGNVRRATWCGFFPVETRNALVIHLAGTGDHSFLRRKLGFANSLLKMGISSILLENPFYGTRKPSNQFRSNLNNVSDLFVMGGALIAECNFLLNWAKESGYSPLGLSGVSMGGYMASLAYTNSSGPVSLVPCLSSSTAAPVFVKGALSHAVSWDFLDIELKNKSFRNAIKQIPDCEWIEKAYELNKCTKGISSHGVAKQFMYILMEEFTNIGMYPKPFDTSLVKNIIAEKDAYIVRSSEPTMQDIWPGSCVEILKGVGHVTAYLTNHAIFRRSIVEMLHRNDRIYHGFS